jgi:flagellum-specific ATP synthase
MTHHHVEMLENLKKISTALHSTHDSKIFGKIIKIQGLSLKSTRPTSKIKIGDTCLVKTDQEILKGEVQALDDQSVTFMLSSSLQGISLGHLVEFQSTPLSIYPCERWLGRVIDAYGNPKDNKGDLLKGDKETHLRSFPINVTERDKITQPLDLGVKSLNTFTTVGLGQRLGVFSGSGVGKSVLISMIAKYSSADINIIGLVGERGREVKEFIEDTLGESGLKKSILVVETSDSPPLARKHAAYTTLALSEYFRDQGKKVLCVIDSVTRFAMALREIGLSCGEPPTTKGYPPSIFSELPLLLERAGPGKTGTNSSITGIFSILVDGDDHNEPIADAARGILDGHIVLERKIAERSQYPAVNVLKSISRLAPICQTTDQKKITQKARMILSTYYDMEDLIRLGAYQEGANPDVDLAISLYPRFFDFFSQLPEEHYSLDESFDLLKSIVDE